MNLSVLPSGGNEAKDSRSSGKQRGKDPVPNPRPAVGHGKRGVWKIAWAVSQPVDAVRPVTAPLRMCPVFSELFFLGM